MQIRRSALVFLTDSGSAYYDALSIFCRFLRRRPAGPARRSFKEAAGMKRLYIIGGTMGVGKTTACQLLKQRLPSSVFLDGDWCWDMHPFQVTEETKAMVMENICFLLNRFLACSAYENVIFCWVLHEQDIWDTILSRLSLDNVEVKTAALVCSPESLRRRLQKDIAAGIRTPDVLERSTARLPLYQKLDVTRLDVSCLTPEQTAKQLSKL
jgi:hypothetical protein